MITINNSASNSVDWFIMPKYDCDTANAVGSGSLAAGGSTTFNTSNSQTVVFDVGDGFTAGSVCSSSATVTFHNDPNGAWCQTV